MLGVSHRTAGFVIAAVVAMIAVGGVAYWQRPPGRAAPEKGVVAIRPKAEPSTIAPSPSPGPAASAPMIPGTVPGPPVEVKVTSTVLADLKLPATAVFSATTLEDADDRVICGEVALDRSAPFRRFVYIAESRSGFVDDGGPVFAQVHAVTCAGRK